MIETEAVGSCLSLGGFPFQYDDLKRRIRYSGGQTGSDKERCPLDMFCHLLNSAHTTHYAFVTKKMESFNGFHHSHVKREDLCWILLH